MSAALARNRCLLDSIRYDTASGYRTLLTAFALQWLVVVTYLIRLFACEACKVSAFHWHQLESADIRELVVGAPRKLPEGATDADAEPNVVLKALDVVGDSMEWPVVAAAAGPGPAIAAQVYRSIFRRKLFTRVTAQFFLRALALLLVLASTCLTVGAIAARIGTVRSTADVLFQVFLYRVERCRVSTIGENCAPMSLRGFYKNSSDGAYGFPGNCASAAEAGAAGAFLGLFAQMVAFGLLAVMVVRRIPLWCPGTSLAFDDDDSDATAQVQPREGSSAKGNHATAVATAAPAAAHLKDDGEDEPATARPPLRRLLSFRFLPFYACTAGTGFVLLAWSYATYLRWYCWGFTGASSGAFTPRSSLDYLMGAAAVCGVAALCQSPFMMPCRCAEDGDVLLSLSKEVPVLAAAGDGGGAMPAGAGAVPSHEPQEAAVPAEPAESHPSPSSPVAVGGTGTGHGDARTGHPFAAPSASDPDGAEDDDAKARPL